MKPSNPFRKTYTGRNEDILLFQLLHVCHASVLVGHKGLHLEVAVDNVDIALKVGCCNLAASAREDGKVRL